MFEDFDFVSWIYFWLSVYSIILVIAMVYFTWFDWRQGTDVTADMFADKLWPAMGWPVLLALLPVMWVCDFLDARVIAGKTPLSKKVIIKGRRKDDTN